MGQNINGVNGALRAQVLQQLAAKGIQDKNLEKYSDEELFKFAEQNGVRPGAALEHSDAAPATEEQKLARRTRKETDQEFVAKTKAYADAQAKYDALLQKEQQVRLEYNKAMKKTTKKSLQYDGKDVAKDEARKLLEEDLNQVRKDLAAARQEMLEAKKALGGDDQVRAANRYTREQAAEAEKDKDGKDKVETQRAARAEVRDYYQTEEGKREALEQARQLARGDADHKLSHAERRARRDEVKEQIGDVSDRYAGLTQKRAEKNYQQLLKEQALQKVIIGDKDAYKAERKDDENGHPTVTYMDEKTYNAAKDYAASKGVVLPDYEKGMVLEGDKMREFQQVMIDAAGDFGSRADLNERHDIADNFRDISFSEAKKMIEAANVDVQKSYRTAAAVAGVAASVATAGIGGLWSVVPAIADQIIPGAGEMIYVPGENGVAGTGHYEFQDLIIKGADGSRKFKLGTGIAAATAGPVVATLVQLIGNHDPNLLKKDKTLADVVYNTLEDVPAFKKWTPNAKKMVSKFVADPDLTPEQKLAILQKAMGEEGTKLNPRELLAGINEAKAFKQGGDLPTIETEDVGKSEQTVYILKDGVLVDKNNKPAPVDDLVDEYGKPFEIKGKGAQGAAVDPKLAAKTGKPTIATNVDFTHNPNNPGDLTQIIISDEDGEVTNVTGNDVTEPDSFTLNDNSNGPDHRNSYEFRKLTAEEITQNKLDPAKGPFYTLVSAKGPNAEDIGQSIGKVFSYTFAEHEQQDTAHKMENGQIVEDVTITKKTPQYLLDAATMIGSSSPVYIKTGAKPKVAPAAKPKVKPKAKPQPKQQVKPKEKQGANAPELHWHAPMLPPEGEKPQVPKFNWDFRKPFWEDR